MSALNRILPLALAAAVLLLFAAACGGSATVPSTSDQPTDDQTVADDGASDDIVSIDPGVALAASAESFAEEVESLHAEMDFQITTGVFDMDVAAEMAFRAPDQMHLTMELTGLGSFEMLLLGQDIYMNIPFQGWVVFSMEDLLSGIGGDSLGADADAFQDLFEGHSFVDYEALVGGLGGDIEDLGDETIAGVTYRHFRGTLDFAQLSDAFSDAFGATSDLGLEDVTGPLTFDAWVDPETLLPHKLVATGEIAFGEESLVFDGAMIFSDYNEAVEIPSPPAEAIPFADLLSGAFQ